MKDRILGLMSVLTSLLTSGLLQLLARRESFSSRRVPRRSLDRWPRPGSPAPGLRHIGRTPRVTALAHAEFAWLRIRGFPHRPARIHRVGQPELPEGRLREDWPALRARAAGLPPP